MPLESANQIWKLNPLFPLGADPVGQGDDHLRMIKRSLNNFYHNDWFDSLVRQYAMAGYTLVDGSFEEGGVLTGEKDVLLYKETGYAYSWNGSFTGGQHIVTPGTDPSISGSGYTDRHLEYFNAGTQVTRSTKAEAKARIDFAEGELVYLTDVGYHFRFTATQELIEGQSQSEMTFDDEVHVLVASGGMLVFDDWQLLSQIETLNYARYHAKYRSRAVALGVGVLADSIGFGQALPNTVGATNKIGVATNYGDGSTHANWQYNNNWPKVLGDIMSSSMPSVVTVNNLGYSGDRALTGYLRHRATPAQDVSIIAYGINDVLFATGNGSDPAGIYNNVLYNLMSFQKIIRKHVARELLRGRTVILAGTTVFGGLSGWDSSAFSANRLTKAYDAVCASVAKEFGCMYVDVKMDIFRQYNVNDVLQEGTHLNEAGCRVMAGRMAAVVLSRWKTPVVISGASSVLSNPSVSDMTGRSANTALPNGSSNSPSFSTSEPSTIAVDNNPVFYPIYAAEDSLLVVPEMIGSAAGALIQFQVNGGAALPARPNVRDLGYNAGSLKQYNLTGTHSDELIHNWTSDGFFIALAVKGWHLLEVKKISGTGGAVLDAFTFYPELALKEKHQKGVTALCDSGNLSNYRASVAANGAGLYTVTFTSPMQNTGYRVLVDQVNNNDAQFHNVINKTTNGFQIQFLSGTGAGLGISFDLQDPTSFSAVVFGGR